MVGITFTTLDAVSKGLVLEGEGGWEMKVMLWAVIGSELYLIVYKLAETKYDALT